MDYTSEETIALASMKARIRELEDENETLREECSDLRVTLTAAETKIWKLLVISEANEELI